MKEDQTLLVLYSKDIVGHLIKTTNGISFIYAAGWVNNKYAFPLSSSIPLIEGITFRKEITPFLAGLLSEDHQILENLKQSHQINIKNSFEVLSVVGEDCAGAFSFIKPENHAKWSQSSQEKIKCTAADIANLIESGDTNIAEFTQTQGKLSLAGAQKKFALLKENGNWYRTNGDLATTHIIKPNYMKYPGLVENEFFCMSLAKKIGIPVANVAIVNFIEHKVLCVERYDRHITADGVFRIHQEDLCQAFGINPSHKYQNQNNIGVQDVIRLLDQVSYSKKEDITTFIKAIIFNILICGTDAHLKNYSLLILPESKIQLAPLYDLISIYPYFKYMDSNKARVKMSMKINQTYIWNRIGYSDIINNLTTAETRKFDIDVDDIFINLCTELVNNMNQVFANTINAGNILENSAEHKTISTIKNEITATVVKYLKYSQMPQ